MSTALWEAKAPVPEGPELRQWQWEKRGGAVSSSFASFLFVHPLFSLDLNHKDEIVRQHLTKFLISAFLNIHKALRNLLIPFLD